MKSYRIFRSTLILAVLVIAGAASLFPSEISAETECQKIRRKNAPIVADFKARYANSSPTVILTAIQESDSVELARMKFLSLEPEKRKAVWQTKFAQIAPTKYAPARARVVKKAADLIDTLKFDGTDEIQPIQALGQEILEVFDKNEVREIFASLSTSPSLMKASLNIGKCNCAYGFDLCNEGYHCQLSAPGMWYCSVSSWGCGLFWIYPCDGSCV